MISTIIVKTTDSLILLANNVDATIINAGDGANEHPTQALLDSYSIKEKIGNLKNRNILIVGDISHSRVALSNIYALQLQGANVMVCGPKTLIPKYLHKLGVKVEYDFLKALKWCDVVNMLRLQNERMTNSFFPSVREYVQQYGLTLDMLKSLDKEIYVMHPGPINRNVEIESSLADDLDKSLINEQVENGRGWRSGALVERKELTQWFFKISEYSDELLSLIHL